MNQNEESVTMEVMPATALEAINRAEIDTQVATAHKFPRSMAQFKRRATEMATLDEETAASCIYSRPVGGGKFAEGLSVRMAEIVGASYGNLRVGAMIISQTDRQVIARGYAHDLESNFASTSEVIESTVKKDGKPYDERMRVVIAKAALSKARRDATFTVVPKALCKPIEAEARKVAVGDASTLANRRSLVMAWIGKLGIDQNRVFSVLKIKGENEIGLDELAILTGLKTSIKDGDVTVDEAFPAADSTTPRKMDDLKAPDENPKVNKTEAPADIQKEEKPVRKELDNPVDEIELRVKEEGISEEVFNQWTDAKGLVIGGKLSVKTIRTLLDNWASHLDDLKAFAGAGK